VGAKLATWLQVIGNFGLILGLVLVAVQIKQSSDLARVQMGHDGWLALMAIRHSEMGENPQFVIAKMRRDPESLTDAELVAADHYFQNHVTNNLGRVEYVNDAGLDLWSEEMLARGTVDLLSDRIGLAWWDLNSRGVAEWAPRVAARVDQLLSGREIPELSYYEKLRNRIEQ